MDANRRRIVIVVFDGLRPDMVTAELMPALRSFADDGAFYAESRCAFPSETRVNQASLVTGCWPGSHGIVGNKFHDPAAPDPDFVNSGDDDHLRDFLARAGGALLDRPSLGERLAAAGRDYAVIGSGTPGGTRMLYHTAEAAGGLRLSLYRPDRSCPADRVARILARTGAIPAVETPANARTAYVMDAFLGTLAGDDGPAVSLLWFFEPDLVYHLCGVGSEESLSALRHADAQFARLLDWRERQPAPERIQVVTLSDHGHVTVSGQPVDLVAELREAGFAAAGDFRDPAADMAAYLSRAGGIYLRRRDPGLLRELAAWLATRDWLGHLIGDVEGCRDSPADYRLAHRRCPDLVLVTAGDDAGNDRGWAGRARSGVGGPATGCGNHGGLHRREMNNWLAAQGDGFRPGAYRERVHIVDVLPSLMALLGLAVDDDVDGTRLPGLQA